MHAELNCPLSLWVDPPHSHHCCIITHGMCCVVSYCIELISCKSCPKLKTTYNLFSPLYSATNSLLTIVLHFTIEVLAWSHTKIQPINGNQLNQACICRISQYLARDKFDGNSHSKTNHRIERSIQFELHSQQCLFRKWFYGMWMIQFPNCIGANQTELHCSILTMVLCFAIHA